MGCAVNLGAVCVCRGGGSEALKAQIEKGTSFGVPWPWVGPQGGCVGAVGVLGGEGGEGGGRGAQLL